MLSSQLAEALKQEIDALVASYEADLRTIPPPPGGGFLEFAGYGASAVGSIGSAYVPPPVDSYDDTVTSERLGAIADPFGGNEVEVLSPAQGIVIGGTNLPLVHEGDALFHIVHVEGTQVAARCRMRLGRGGTRGASGTLRRLPR